MMVAIWNTLEVIAVAFCSMPSGATPGRSALMAGLSNAREAPITVTAPKISGTVSQCMNVPQAKNTETAASVAWQICTTRRRS